MSKDPIQDLAMEYFENDNEENFNKLYNRVLPTLRNHIWGFIYVTKSRDLLNEIVQRTWMKFITKKHQYDKERGAFSTWLFAIGRHEAFKELGACKGLISLDSLFETENEEFATIDIASLDNVVNKENYETTFKDLCEETEDKINSKNLRIIILWEMNKLPTIYKDILVDNLLWKMKYHQLADKYNIPINTLKSRIRVGKEMLRAELSKRSIGIDSL